MVYGSDHGADWEMAAPVPLELYMEQLIVDLGHNRLIVPNKWTRISAIHNYYGSTGHLRLAPSYG